LRIIVCGEIMGGMKPLTINDPDIILGLQDEIRRSDESRYDHRLHGVLLVAQGMTCPEVAGLLGASSRSVQYWLRRFQEDGIAGLSEKDRPGRPPCLNEKQLTSIGKALREAPVAHGLSGNLWDGKTLSAFIERKFHVSLGTRQCQRLFRQLGFRLRKPRPAIAHADVELQKRHKKNSGR
jgi:transposase